MEYKQFGSDIVLRVERGEEISTCLKELAEQEDVKVGSVSGIGAAHDIVLGWYHVPTKDYRRKTFEGEHEITGLLGNISRQDGEVYLHVHATIGDEEANAFAGHFESGVVSGTFEAIIHVIDGEVDRFSDDETGLNLLSLSS